MFKFFNYLTVILALCFLFNNEINAQTLQNGNFSNYCNAGHGTSDDNIDQCTPHWSSSHGSPSVFGYGNGSAWMWSKGGTGEGIYASYDFDEGQCYEVTFRVKGTSTGSHATNNTEFFVRAANNITPNINTQIPSASSFENIWVSDMSPYLNNWQTVSVLFEPDQDFSQIWFLPFYESYGGTPGMEVDDISITPINNPSISFDADFNTYLFSGTSIGVYLNWATSLPSGVNQLFDIYYADSPGGTSGSTQVPGNSALVNPTSWQGFWNNLECGEHYYIKHGIYGECVPWQEKRYPVYHSCSCGNGCIPRLADSSTDHNNAKLANFPNPFEGETTIEFTLYNPSEISLMVKDISGKTVKKIIGDEYKAKGKHQVKFDGTNYPTGIYYYTLESEKSIQTQKMIITD